MAWNQPGGNGGRDPNRDPWGDRGGQQGPPDLDEALKKLQNQLGRIFGKKSGGGGGGSGGGFKLGAGGSLSLGLIALVALGLWVFSGIFIVEPAEQGVVTRFGKFVRTVGPGPHWAPKFIEEVTTVNVQQVRSEEIGFSPSRGKVPSEALMLTADENIVDIEFVVQFRVSDAKDFLFQVRDPTTTLRQAIESAVREVVGRNDTDFVLTEGREAVASEVQTISQTILDRYRAGLFIESTNMQDAQPPEEVQEAFLDAIKAREDQVRVINEAKAYRNDLLPKARGESEAIRERAQGYKQRIIAKADGEADRFLSVLREYEKAPEVTRERLYLDAVESVMANSSKVMVDVEGGNNLMYLPLDKLINQNNDRPNTSGASRIDSQTATSAELGRNENRRSRDGRSR